MIMSSHLPAYLDPVCLFFLHFKICGWFIHLSGHSMIMMMTHLFFTTAFPQKNIYFQTNNVSKNVYFRKFSFLIFHFIDGTCQVNKKKSTKHSTMVRATQWCALVRTMNNPRAIFFTQNDHHQCDQCVIFLRTFSICCCCCLSSNWC